MKDFKEKVLVVTGAASGLGEAVALEGARRGMKLVLNDMNETGVKSVLDKVKALGSEGVMQAADASTLATIQDLYTLTMDTYGQVDMLMNNAGVGAAINPIWEIPIQDITWLNEANFLGHAYGVRIFLPQMIKQKTPAAIINVASAAALVFHGNSTVYSATKQADLVLAECTSMALREHGYDYVQMHAFCPSYIQTKLYESDLKYRPERYSDMSDPYYQSESFKASQKRNKNNVTGGMPIDSVGKFIFTCVEENKFFILTHPDVLVRRAAEEANLMSQGKPGGHLFP